MTRRILVTSALPYANGSIHIGHLVEYIQTDIWVRFQKLIGNTCHYMCADDTHGTPIMLSAKKQGITPQALIAAMRIEHLADFADFHVEFDNYHSTDSIENQELAEYIFCQAQQKGAIEEQTIEQYFCPSCQIFLPDRLIRGTCPSCKAEDQYGDSCEHCSSTYRPTELISPKCAECSAGPILKTSSHFFFKLSKFTDVLHKWIHEGHVRTEITNKLEEWFKKGLQDWDITRDEPYFGFKIPGSTDKYFYVWMDAPVGYIAATKNWCDKSGVSFDDIWKNGQYEIHHFIGKDILYFHALFWPAMLMVSDFVTPTKVNIHGFLTVNGEKMSKSRGTFIKARKYLDHLNPEFLRYYYAAKLSASVEDLDLSLQDFVFKVNSDVINKVVNIGSRLGAIITKKLIGHLSTPEEEGLALLQTMRQMTPAIEQYYETLDYHKAMRDIMQIADMANKYINDKAPWDLVKTDPSLAAQVCTTGLNALRLITILLKPVLPVLTVKIESFLNISPLRWEDLSTLLEHHTVSPFEKLADRIDLAQAEQILG